MLTVDAHDEVLDPLERGIDGCRLRISRGLLLELSSSVVENGLYAGLVISTSSHEAQNSIVLQCKGREVVAQGGLLEFCQDVGR